MLKTLANDPGELPIKNVTIHRAKLKEELLSIFKEENIFKFMIVVDLIGYNGKSEMGVGSGVLREVFASFWQIVGNSLCVGSDEKVSIALWYMAMQQ